MIQMLGDPTKSLVLLELQDRTPIIVTKKKLPYCLKNRSITVQIKKFPLKLAFTITLPNSKGSSLEYMKVNFDCTSKTGKVSIVPINQGAAYTALSYAKVVQNFNY